MAKEINLVPDIKDEFIRALKFRNFVFFLCIVVASASLVVILIFLSIAGGQQGFITAKQNTIDALEQKISSYSDLSTFLTVRDQISNLTAITENKVMMSRTFNILSALFPVGSDYVNISTLSVNLGEDENATFKFDAQANAGTEPFIDYKVLEAFKKSMNYMRYDYGEYVDKNDQAIPAYCIVETAEDGSMLKDPDNGYYAYWLIQGEGCNPSAEEEEEEEEETEEDTKDDIINLDSDSLLTEDGLLKEQPTVEVVKQEPSAEELSQKTGYKVEDFVDYNGQKVVKIWRTPQYSAWYKADPKEGEAYMDLDGGIHNIQHFNSSCISYSGSQKEDDPRDKSITWAITNDSCLLVPEGDNGGIKIDSSSNGRDSGGELVLRFTAVIKLSKDVFNFNNHHMLALPPSGHRNVTDSYIQIQNIFAERAADCDKNDTVCATTPIGEDLIDGPIEPEDTGGDNLKDTEEDI